jgi:hypothetical protein
LCIGSVKAVRYGQSALIYISAAFCEYFQLLISRLASQHAHRHQVTPAIDVAKDVAEKRKSGTRAVQLFRAH